MSLSSRRRSERGGINIWPGFVDALSQLIMVIVFVLLIFTAGQFFLTDAISGRDAALKQLTDQLNQLTDVLALERKQNTDLKLTITQLTQQLASANQQNQALTAQMQGLQQKSDETAQKLAAAQSQLAEAQRSAAAAASDQQSQIAARDTRISDLSTQIDALKQELARLADALDASDAKNKEQQIQLADLGRRLNQALASKVEELARYRSEFFGRLREVLGDRQDIRVVGDRFVFQSEVLFPPGSAALSPEAQERLKPVADAIKTIAPKIPTDLPWVLQVGGHTDKLPINTPQFPSNWELSTARALSVVRYLAAQGIPADRLSAAGYGEYEPIDPGDTPDAYRKNRRIELKLTER
jgi:chemotaxis protein MotB